MKSIVRSIVFAGVMVSTSGAAFATIGGTAPTPHPQSQQSSLVIAFNYALSLFGL